MLHKDAREKVVRYDGTTIPGDLHHIVPTPSDPRKRKNVYWNQEKEDAMELPVPRLLIDANYVGEPPKVEVTIDNLNDNVDQQFLAKAVQKFGAWEELKIEYHPLTKKHLGKFFIYLFVLFCFKWFLKLFMLIFEHISSVFCQ